MAIVAGIEAIICTIKNKLIRWTRKTMRNHFVRRGADPASIDRSFIRPRAKKNK